jgi:hypothetical protein
VIVIATDYVPARLERVSFEDILIDPGSIIQQGINKLLIMKCACIHYVRQHIVSSKTVTVSTSVTP